MLSVGGLLNPRLYGPSLLDTQGNAKRIFLFQFFPSIVVYRLSYAELTFVSCFKLALTQTIARPAGLRLCKCDACVRAVFFNNYNVKKKNGWMAEW